MRNSALISVAVALALTAVATIVAISRTGSFRVGQPESPSRRNGAAQLDRAQETLEPAQRVSRREEERSTVEHQENTHELESPGDESPVDGTADLAEKYAGLSPEELVAHALKYKGLFESLRDQEVERYVASGMAKLVSDDPDFEMDMPADDATPTWSFTDRGPYYLLLTREDSPELFALRNEYRWLTDRAWPHHDMWPRGEDKERGEDRE